MTEYNNSENTKRGPLCGVCNRYFCKMGYAVAQLVEALRYKPVDRGFDS